MPRAPHLRYRRETGVEIGEFHGGVFGGLRFAEHAQGRPGNHAEGTLAADEKVVQIRTGGLLGHGTGLDDASIGKDDFQRHHLIAHGPEGGGAVAHAVGGYGAGHAGDGNAVRVVARHEPVGFQRVVQVLQDQPGLDLRRLRNRVDADHPVEPAKVKNDPAAHGHYPAHDAGAAAVRDQRNPGALGQRDDLRNLDGIRRSHYDVGQAVERSVGVVRPIRRQGIGRITVQRRLTSVRGPRFPFLRSPPD